MSSFRSSTRTVRFVLLSLLLIVCLFVLSRNKNHSPPRVAQTPIVQDTPITGLKVDKSQQIIQNTNAGTSKQHIVGSEKLVATPGEKIKATFVALARNSDLKGIINSMRQVEDRFNKNYHYDYVFLNEVEFTDEFKELTSAIASGNTHYGLIPEEQWSVPDWIDQDKFDKSRQEMIKKKVIYGGSVPYRHMCRYESGFFWRHPILDDYEYYWRIDPDIRVYCDIDYDIFKFLKDNKKRYSFTITLPEYHETIPTLWETTKEFMKLHPEYLAENNMLDWISDDGGETYNRCHFWSNFEIADLNFLRSDAYKAYFEHLDKAGGFFYERWGDAPVHSIAVALFMNKDEVHFFDDIGYFHGPFHNCPVDPEIRKNKKCVCDHNDDFTWKKYSCTTKYHKIKNLKHMKGWEAFHT